MYIATYVAKVFQAKEHRIYMYVQLHKQVDNLKSKKPGTANIIS